MMGLVDYDLQTSTSVNLAHPNLEIMKLATYYKTEKNLFCRLVSLDEEDLTNYSKIYFFSESDYQPEIPPAFLRAQNVVFGGTAFTNGKYIPFQNPIIDFTIPRPAIYKEFLKQKYDDGVKAKVISGILDNSYYRCYANNEKLPIPPIISNKRVILYDRDFFYPDWRETLDEISSHKPSTIIRVHPIICNKLSDFFEVRNYGKLQRLNKVVLDLDIPLEEVYYMLSKYKNYFLADITKTSNVYLKLGDTYKTSFQYFNDFIYKINLLFCMWSYKIPIKILYIPPHIGYKNPLQNLSQKVETWSDMGAGTNATKSINDRITRKTKKTIWEDERDLLLKFHPTAINLFTHSYNSISQGGRWRI